MEGNVYRSRVAAFPSAVRDLAVSRSGVYAATDGNGVFRSTDGGRNWVSVSEGLPGSGVALLTADPLVPARLYAGTPADGAFVSRFTSGGS